jgi:hypothetical protein
MEDVLKILYELLFVFRWSYSTQIYLGSAVVEGWKI